MHAGQVLPLSKSLASCGLKEGSQLVVAPVPQPIAEPSAVEQAEESGHKFGISGSFTAPATATLHSLRESPIKGEDYSRLDRSALWTQGDTLNAVSASADPRSSDPPHLHSQMMGWIRLRVFEKTEMTLTP